MSEGKDGNDITRTYREEDLQELKSMIKPLFDADPSKKQTDACLKRFLKAFLSVEEALSALLKYIKWREEFGVSNLTDSDPDIKVHLTTGKAVVLDRRDNCGRPIMLVTARFHEARTSEVESITKFIVYLLETATSHCDEEVIDNLCIAFDLKGFALSNMDYSFVKQLIWLLSRRYPERLGKCLIINAPLLFSSCWSLIRLWINEVTAAKIIFIRDEEHLEEFLSLEALPNSLFR